MSTSLVRIPNMLALTPFKWNGMNPHYSPTMRSTVEWIHSQGTLDEVKSKRLDDVWNEYFGGATYNYADYEMLLILNDSVAVVFLIDEFTDIEDYEGAMAIKKTVMDAITGKSPDDHSIIANFSRE